MPDDSPLLGHGTSQTETYEHENKHVRRVYLIVVASTLFLLSVSIFTLSYKAPVESCDHPRSGYWCVPRLSHYWGQYTPYFQVPSELDPAVPRDCNVTAVQVLSRHGARSPTKKAAEGYRRTIDKLHNADAFNGVAAFLSKYRYTMPEDLLTDFGRQQMVNSGYDLALRYSTLSGVSLPFIRASGNPRVIESAEKWAAGYQQATNLGKDDSASPHVPILAIPETAGNNNSLTHGLCSNFESGPLSSIGITAQREFAETFTRKLRRRLNALIPGVYFDSEDVIHLMELCPFTSVAELIGELSAFCGLFTERDFMYYNHYASLGKYYGYGAGNPMGPTQGVGYVNEVIARLTGTAVSDQTSTNRTLDSNLDTFPLNPSVYADFTHDNVMTSVMFALGLFSDLEDLSRDTVQDISATKGYSSARTVPFAARIFIEKMSCTSQSSELVRVLVNGRVVPLKGCERRDRLGRCELDDFVSSLKFARDGGRWDECFH